MEGEREDLRVRVAGRRAAPSSVCQYVTACDRMSVRE